MDGRRKRGRLLALLAGALLAASGCVYVQQQPGMAAAPTGQPRAPVAQAITYGAGGSVGFLAAVDPFLDPGFMFDIHGTAWLNPMLGVQVDIAGTTMADTFYGGQLTVVPVYVSAILSFPNPETWEWAGENARLRLGVGVGGAGVLHTNGSTASVPIFNVQTGYEWLFPAGGRAFALADFMFGDWAVGTGAEVWDLQFMITVRVGLEFKL